METSLIVFMQATAGTDIDGAARMIANYGTLHLVACMTAVLYWSVVILHDLLGVCPW